MKKKQLILTIAISALTLVILACVVFWPRTPVIAFYQVPPVVKDAITKVALDPANAGEKRFRIRTLDPAKSLADQIASKPAIDILFTWDGEDAQSIAAKTIAPAEPVRRLMPSAMRQAGQSGEKIYGLPILLDHFEVAYHKRLFAQAGKNEPETLDELNKAARAIKKPTVWPIVCAGAQDEDLMMLVSTVTEAISGPEGRDQVVAAMKKGQTLKELTKTTALGPALKQLIDWRKQGFLHPEWIRMKNNDITSFMENDYAGIVFMPLSTHRTIPVKIIEKFDSITMPSIQKSTNRCFTMPVLLGMLISRKRPNARASDFLYSLVKEEGQKGLGDATGLAPINSTAEAQDRQATDLRFWAAASNHPAPDIARAAFATSDKRNAFATDVRNYLESNGEGY